MFRKNLRFGFLHQNRYNYEFLGQQNVRDLMKIQVSNLAKLSRFGFFDSYQR